jgi:hypothetical protein
LEIAALWEPWNYIRAEVEMAAMLQPWSYYIRADDPHHTDPELLQWAQSTMGGLWTFLDLSGATKSPCRAFGGNDEMTCEMITLHGDSEVLQWARANGCPWNAGTCSVAAINGHLELLVWAHENGSPWDGETFHHAVIGGYLEVLRYAHENGCPWGKETCNLAACDGHLEILQYAHTNGCPWNRETCVDAVVYPHCLLVYFTLLPSYTAAHVAPVMYTTSPLSLISDWLIVIIVYSLQ